MRGNDMNRQTQFRVTAVVLCIAMILIMIITVGSAGKTKINYISKVTVKDGAVSDNKNQSIYLKAPGDSCSIKTSASGQKGISTDIFVYGDATMKESYLTITGAEKEQTSKDFEVKTDGILLVLDRKVQDGAIIGDGTYEITYDIQVSAGGGFGTFLVTLMIVLVSAGLFLVMINLENKPGRGLTKRQVRTRGKAYMCAFYVVSAMLLAFTLISAFVKQMPFTIFQIGMISFVAAGTTAFILGDKGNAYPKLQQKRGTITIAFAVVCLLNLIACFIGLFGKTTASTPSGTGVVGGWIVNLVIALCFLGMIVEMFTNNPGNEDYAG